jgi:glycosyltransferase 2 family protein
LEKKLFNNLFSKLRSFSLNIFSLLTQVFQKLQKNRKLSLAVNIGLIAVIGFVTVNFLLREWDQLKNIQIQFDYLKLFWAFLLFGGNNIIFIIAWHFILNGLQSKSTLLDDIYIYSYSQVAKLLPTPTWYLAGRMLLYQRVGIGKRVMLIISLLEAALHAWIGFLVYIMIGIQTDPFANSLWLTLAIMATLLLILFARWYAGTKNYQIPTRVLVSRFIAVSALFLITWVISLPFFQYIIGSIVANHSMPVLEIWKSWIVASLYAYIGMLTLGGVGVVREFSLVFFLSPYFSPPIALAIVVISRIIATLGSLIWSGIFMIVTKWMIQPGMGKNLTKSERN